MPKELQTVVRQGRKVLANLWLKEVLTTRDTCFFFQPPSLDGDATLDMKQKFHKQLGMTWRHVRPAVSRHSLAGSPYQNLAHLMQGPLVVAYPEEAVDRSISTKAVLGLAKEFNLGLQGAKWRNTFLSAQEVKELKSEAVYRGEILALLASSQRTLVQALNVHFEKETGEGEGKGDEAAAAPAAPGAAAAAPGGEGEGAAKEGAKA